MGEWLPDPLRPRPSFGTVVRRSRLLRPERLADRRIYMARVRLLKAYQQLVRVESWDNLGQARAHCADALDLLDDLFGFDD
jgi:hypothetical protein